MSTRAMVAKTDITLEHFRALNVSIKHDLALEDLLPHAPDESSYFPPSFDFEQSIAFRHRSSSCIEQRHPSSSNSRYIPSESGSRSNNGKGASWEVFTTRLQELLVGNDDAFRTLSHLPLPEGQTAPRLAHFRRFWEGLDLLSQYWDSSLDSYFSIPASSASEQGPSRPSMGSTTDRDMTTRSASPSAAVQLKAQSSPPFKRAKPSPRSPLASTPVASNPGDQRYRGRRISTGSLAPPLHLSETLHSFIEPIAWAFSLQIQPPRRLKHLYIQNLCMPVALDAGVYVTPSDRQRARRGELIGPVMGLQSRPYVGFDASRHIDDKEGRESFSRDTLMEEGTTADGIKVLVSAEDGQAANMESVIDLLREVSALLLLAQERAREGRSEVQPGKDKWWTTVPRWGGGRGGEVGNPEWRNSDDPISMANRGSGHPGIEREDRVRATRVKHRDRQKSKMTPADAWKVLKPGLGLWDPKTTYKAIGKQKGSDWDNIFLISALNHHISIMRLEVHLAYIDYLTTGTFPDPSPEDDAWCNPKLYRTAWYDLFDVQQRAEAMRGVWGVLAFLMRGD